jgi:hypothetical protein
MQVRVLSPNGWKIKPNYRSSKNPKETMYGLAQFSNEVRTVDMIGLFASGALAGASLAGFLISRKN